MHKLANIKGKVDNATYETYIFGLNPKNMGRLIVEIESYIDSEYMRSKAIKKVLSKLGLDKIKPFRVSDNPPM